MHFTEAQRKAIYTLDKNLVVVAGAGSGKTSVLVNRYLQLLEQHRGETDWSLSSIVAITFTEKAAKEMRARVRDAIDKRAETSGDDQAHWRKYQQEMDSARISTIHSLCALLLRANAAEANIDPAFQVLDEADAALLADEAIEQAMVGIAADDVMTSLFEAWTPDQIRRALRSHLETEITETRPAAELYAAWEQFYPSASEQLLTELRAAPTFSGLLNWRPDVAPAPDDDDKIGAAYYLVQQCLPDVLSGATEVAYRALEQIAELDLRGGSASKWGGKEGKAEAVKVLGAIRDTAKAMLKQRVPFDPEVEHIAAQFTACWNAAIQHTQATFRQMKQERALLDFADLERRARELLQFDEVCARYRGREFQYLLVDEFQDTNAAQRDIIYALTGLNRATQQASNLFVVGDPKQSIYAFRGAQVEVFDEVRNEIVTRGGEAVDLARSFRSHLPLVGLFNTLFQPLLEGYTAMDSERKWHDPEIIDVIALRKQERADGEKMSADNMRAWQAAELALYLKQRIETQTLIYDKERRVTRTAGYGDCAVLFQAIAHMTYVEDAFKRLDIPYVTHAGRGYYNRPEVWDLLNLLKALHNPADNLALASALRAPLFGLDDDILYKLRQMPYALLWDALHAAELDNLNSRPLQFAKQTLPELAAMAQRVTLPELLNAILRATAYTAVLRGQEDGARKVNNVEKLIEMARRNSRLSLGEFLRYLEELTDRETREGEAAIETGGAVQLMTVHAAKGLEFPIVALFDCSYEHHRVPELLPLPGAGIVCKIGEATPYLYALAAKALTEAEREEKLRRFYVAATRAQDYLVIIGDLHDGKTESKSWERSWMGRFFDVFSLPRDPQTIETSIGNGVRLLCPVAPPALDILYQSPHNGWLLIGSAQCVPLEPPLLVPVPPAPLPPPQTLAATDLAVLGEAHLKAPEGLRQFRNYILHNTPTALRSQSVDRAASQPSQRTRGEIVHKTLQWLHTIEDMPDYATRLEQLIRASAWAQGVTKETVFQPVCDEVGELIEHIRASALWQEIRSAEEIYREYPFSFRCAGRIINGKIDVLFRIGKRWHVVDFKSDNVKPEYLHWHAQRYYMQVGVYAAAVTEALGKAPIVRLHYLRPNVTLKIESEVWRAAVSEIEARLIEAMAKR
jgi:ATP-dependent helicase/nuclease subunit A